jgi:hypothetical protein
MTPIRARSLACFLTALLFLMGCNPLTALYGIGSFIFCKESSVHLSTKIKVQDGHFGMRMWPRSFGQLSIMMIRCDQATRLKISSLHYDTSRISEPGLSAERRPDPDPDTSKGTLLGTLKLYRKKQLVCEAALFPGRYAVGWPDYFGIGNTGLDKFRADSLEIVDASPLLNGLQADFVEYHKCMCRRESGSGQADGIAAADRVTPRAIAF